MSRIFLYLLWVMVLVAYGTNAYNSQNRQTEPLEIAGIKEQIAKLEEENEDLRTQIIEARSYKTINEKARSMGFVDATYWELKK